MILNQLNRGQTNQILMSKHRQKYQKIKQLVQNHKFDQLSLSQINNQKQLVIQHLNNDDQQMYLQFQQLTFYQQRYLSLYKFLQNLKKDKGLLDVKQNNKLIQLFCNFQIDKDIQPIIINKNKSNYNHYNQFQNKSIHQRLNSQNNQSSNDHTGLGKVVYQFFDKKQHNTKNIGFKDLIQKNIPNSNSSKFHQNPRKKYIKQTQDIQISKLLQQNKRLHTQLQKKSKQDKQLNQFQKNVLKQQKQLYIKRIQQLQQQIQQLSKNNYKLQQIQIQKKYISSLIDQSLTNFKKQIFPYNINTRHNDLNLITEKNKLSKINHYDKDNILLSLAEQIPPIEKKQQHSFEEQLNKYNNQPKLSNNNNILADLLQQKQDLPNRQMYSQLTQQKPPQKNRQNDTLDNGGRFDSFSLAKTAYNSSQLFLNASKNLISMQSTTSTRNKISFFKNSLVLIKQKDFDLAFKKSNLDSSLTNLRLIFYINNKTSTTIFVNIQYDYQINYYNLYITQKLKQIPPNQQSRQVLQITLNSSSLDLNSVADVHLLIGQKKYDLWLPICFIQWTKQTLVQNDQLGFMTIQPDRQFITYENLSKLLPLSNKIISNNDQIQTYVYGKSKFGNHQIKLTWYQKQLTIDSSIKILEFLGFIMHHFK